MKKFLIPFALVLSAFPAAAKDPKPLTNEQVLELKLLRKEVELTNANFQLVQARMQMLNMQTEMLQRNFLEQSSSVSKKEEELLQKAGVNSKTHTINEAGVVVQRGGTTPSK